MNLYPPTFRHASADQALNAFVTFPPQVREFSGKHEEEVCQEASESSDGGRREPERSRKRHEESLPEASGLSRSSSVLVF